MYPTREQALRHVKFSSQCRDFPLCADELSQAEIEALDSAEAERVRACMLDGGDCCAHRAMLPLCGPLRKEQLQGQTSSR